MSDFDLANGNEDPFLHRYQPSELKIASEFLTTWLPFLSRDLCDECVQVLSDRVRALDPEVNGMTEGTDNDEHGVCFSTPKKLESGRPNMAVDGDDLDDIYIGIQKVSLAVDTGSLGPRKPKENGQSPLPMDDLKTLSTVKSPIFETPSPRISWADMSQEDELEEDEGHTAGDMSETQVVEKPKLSRDQREHIRLKNVQRKKDFICFERFKGKLVNILEGLELHTGVFSTAEQKRIVHLVYEMQQKGHNGELKERTYSAPKKWMRGKGRVTMQFGCCYNYATDKNGNPPGILQDELVDPIPPLFKLIIRRLIRWRVLPPTCVPDSCIVNLYDEGDCIPPHIDNHDFLRPFCTISFLSECNILFGSNLKVVGPGDFSGSYAIPLPVGSVLVLNGNGADVAKHCVPAVPTKRISITFRKMDGSKWPIGFTPEPDLQGIQPLPYEGEDTRNENPSKTEQPNNNIRQNWRREGYSQSRTSNGRSNAGYEHRSAGYERRGAGYENRSAGYENRSAGYERLGAGYENRSAGYENRSAGYEHQTAGYDNRSAGYEHRSGGYEYRGSGQRRRGSSYYRRSNSANPEN